jgi:hypothetical protein
MVQNSLGKQLSFVEEANLLHFVSFSKEKMVEVVTTPRQSFSMDLEKRLQQPAIVSRLTTDNQYQIKPLALQDTVLFGQFWRNGDILIQKIMPHSDIIERRAKFPFPDVCSVLVQLVLLTETTFASICTDEDSSLSIIAMIEFPSNLDEYDQHQELDLSCTSSMDLDCNPSDISKISTSISRGILSFTKSSNIASILTFD